MQAFFYDYLLPLAILFGMPVKEFWDEDPELLWTYRKVYIEKTKLQSEIDNRNAWLNGLYVYDALSISLHNTFSRSSNILNYDEKPYEFNKTKEEREKEALEESERQIRKRNAEIKAFLAKRGERQG